MKIYKSFRAAVLLLSALTSISVWSQIGNQILDGIGETDLVARYNFDGDVKDWSRNNLHGTLQGLNAKFIDDEKFGKVISFPSDGNTFVSLPKGAISGEESLSVTGWIYLKSSQLNQRFFEFGNSNRSYFFVAPTGVTDKEGLQAEIMHNTDYKYNTGTTAIKEGIWNHLAVVMNTPLKSMRIYLNGTLVGEAKNIELTLEQLFHTNSEFYIGKSVRAGSPNLNANLHDFRIYRIPLNEQQISNIYSNALGNQESAEAEKKTDENDLPNFSDTIPQLYTSYLTKVADIEVETVMGYLPRLPRYLEGFYKEGMKGPKVRVLWPEPTDNAQVLTSGQYTIIGTISGTKLRPQAIVKVKGGKPSATPNKTLEAFHLNQVSLDADLHGHETKFVENRNKFVTTLAQTNPDNFLYMFRNAFGQEQPEGAEPLGVWDSQETKLRGHATGHYLTAIAQAYASTGYDKALQDNFAGKMDYMVNELYQLSSLSGNAQKAGGTRVSDPLKVPPGPSKADYDSELGADVIRTDFWNWGEGFISAYPPDQFIMLENGATYGTQPTQIWAPYYTLHKILAGLMDIYEISGNKKALEITKGMGNWVHARLSQLPTETLISMWNRYIAGEYGGMNEAMARLYRLTNDNKYLETARLFDNIKMFYGDAEHSHGIAKNVDTFRGLHANQHIPQIVGALEMYRGSNAEEYYHVADNFWYRTTNDYMYSIGGVAGARNPANAECFVGQPATLYENGLSSGGQNETCATYNMLKLSSNLFLFDQRAEFMDYYERGLYNHILASVAEDSPANTYHVPLRPGSVKHFGNPSMDGFTCCNGTAIESSTKLQNTIYFKSADNKALYVNLFVPSTLNWTEKNISIEQTTAFPKEDHTKLTVKGKGKFNLNVRVPKWVNKGFFVIINGKEVKVDALPGSYLSLSRNWKDGDTIELRIPFDFHLEPIMDQQNIASLFFGPVLLAAQEVESQKEWRKLTLDVQDIGKSIKSHADKLHFSIDGVDFKPFYETYGRHSVYFDVTLK